MSLASLALHILGCFRVQPSYTISLLPLFPTMLPLTSCLHATNWMPCTGDQTISASHIFPDFNWFLLWSWLVSTEYSGFVSVCVIKPSFLRVCIQTIKVCSGLEVWPCASSSVVESCKLQRVTLAVFNEWTGLKFSFFPHQFWWNINLGLIVLNKFIQSMYLRALVLCEIIGAVGQTFLFQFNVLSKDLWRGYEEDWFSPS